MLFYYINECVPIFNICTTLILIDKYILVYFNCNIIQIKKIIITSYTPLFMENKITKFLL